jgi:signal transduction histidine kinase
VTADPRRRAARVDASLVVLALLDAWFSNARAPATVLSLTVVAALALAVRRRHPFVAFALVVPALFTGYVLIAPLTALYTVAAMSRDRLPIAVCGVIAGLGYVLPWPLDDDVADLFDDPLGLIYAAVFVGGPIALGLLARTRSELSDRLAELTAGRERERELVAQTTLAAERTRLAREMHDVVSHQVSLISVQAGALSTTTADEGAREVAETIRRLSVQTLTELRQMVGVLRASAEQQEPDLAPQPRIDDIPRLVAGSGQAVVLDLGPIAGRRWSDPVERAAYRIVQEALTNVGKHAPGARITVTLAPEGPALRVTVRNAPAPGGHPALPPAGGGHGLVGLRERAEQLGGTFRAGRTTEGGFSVEAVLRDGADAAPVSSAGARPDPASQRWTEPH